MLNNSYDIVVQGNKTQWTEDYINWYLGQDYITNVVWSTWNTEGDKISIKNPKLKFVASYPPPNPGIGNRNLQIISSRNGLKLCTSEHCIKVRSDMLLPRLKQMLEFYEETKRNDDEIFVLGTYPRYPFHPRDHVFIGLKKQLQTLFQIPLDNIEKKWYDVHNDVRSETYIGMWYYAKHDERVNKFIESPKEYLTDNSPKIEDAMQVYLENIGKLFIPFPKVSIFFPKHYPHGYNFDMTKNTEGEWWYKDLFNKGPDWL